MSDITYPYLCGEEECRATGTHYLTMSEMTFHWRSHKGDSDD